MKCGVDIFSTPIIEALIRLTVLGFVGWFMASRGWVVPGARLSLMRLVIWVFFPALIFSRVCNNPLLAQGANALLYLSTGFLMIVIGILVGRVVAWIMGIQEPNKKRTFSYCAGINNFGYLGIPITAALFNDDVVGVLLVHNVGVEAAVWTFGVAFLSGRKGSGFFKDLLQPMTIALLIGLIINFIGWGGSGPILFVTQVTQELGACAIPLGTILTGVYLHETIQGYQFFADIKVTVGIMLARWVLIPLLILGAASTLIDDENLRKVMWIQAAMPAGIFSFLIVEMFKGDIPVALRCSVFTMVFCPLITPLWLYLGSHWLHFSR